MELTKKEQKFSKALEAIEDLYTLGNAELFPLFDRLFYQVGELSRFDSSALDLDTPRYNSIEKLFEKHAQRLVQTYFGSLKGHCHVDLLSNLEGVGLARVDLICELLPHIFNCGDLFNFKQNLLIELNKSDITFKGKIDLPENLESLRIDCYRLSRTFLDLGVLFTFESLEADSESLYDIVFKFAMPDDDSLLLGVRLGEQRWLSFPAMIAKFRVAPEALKGIGKHKIYTIDKNYQLNNIDPENIDEFCLKSQVTALHFPFLFRPISLIISGESTMVEKSILFRQSSTGCDENLEVDEKPIWQHIDLVDLMKN